MIPKEKRFHASCANLGKEELQELESGSESWYCSNCKAECSLCSSLVLNCHKVVQCDKCDIWVHNECSFLSDSQYETMQNTNCTWICPKSENRFNPLGNSDKTKSSTSKSKFIGGLKFFSININRIRGKKLELLAFHVLHEPQIVAIQETKIDISISSSELFQETFPYSVYRKDRTLDGGGVMLLIHKDIPHMPITELEKKSKSVWVKVFANKTAHFVASWYRPPHSGENLTPLEDLQKCDTLFREQLNKIRDKHKGNKPPSVHVLGYFNFGDIVWSDRQNKCGSQLSRTEGQILVDIINDQGFDQLVHFPTRERNLIITSLPNQFVDIHSPDCLSDHDIVSGTLKIVIPPPH